MAGEHPYDQAPERPPEDPYFAEMYGVFGRATTFHTQRTVGVEDPIVTAWGEDIQERFIPAGMLLLDDNGRPDGYVNTEGHARSLEYEEDGETPRNVPEEVRERLAWLTARDDREQVEDDIHYAGHTHHPAGDSTNPYGNAHFHPHGTTPRRGPLITRDFLNLANRRQSRELYEILTGFPGAMTREQAGAWLNTDLGRIAAQHLARANAPVRGRHHRPTTARHRRTGAGVK